MEYHGRLIEGTIVYTNCGEERMDALPSSAAFLFLAVGFKDLINNKISPPINSLGDKTPSPKAHNVVNIIKSLPSNEGENKSPPPKVNGGGRVGNGHIVKKYGKGVKLKSGNRGNGFHGDNIKDVVEFPMNKIKASQIVKPKITKKNILEMHGWNGVPERSMIQKIYQVLVLCRGVYEGDLCRKFTYKIQIPMDKNFKKAKINEGDGDAQGQSHGERGESGAKDKCDGEGLA
ncbi:hypothetical protein Tco_0047933 [Tanacetum coccineum]